MREKDSAPKLAIGVSSFRSDEAALALVHRVLQEPIQFGWLFVVDSQAKGDLGQRLRELDDPRIKYYSEQENIGSAGNLTRRLQIATELGADWLLAFNHDAPVSGDAVSALLAAAAQSEDVGALYPLRFERGRDQFDLSGRRWFPFRFNGRKGAPHELHTPMHWGSSNGALYSLSPVRAGILPEPAFWMCWEDYFYGLKLERNGWRQWLVRDAEVSDTYEFREGNLGGLGVIVSDKPCWYYYYTTRNLLLGHLHFQPSIRGLANLLLWLPVYALRITLFPGQCSRGTAFRNFTHGVLDGLTGRKGRWRLP